jgi:hypothetical protein
VNSQLDGPGMLVAYKENLQSTLRAGLAEGVVEAISACNIDAQGIAEGLSVNGVRMGRTSHRLRNPENVAPDWVGPILEDYVSGRGAPSPKELRISDDHMGYVEPIYLQPGCTACHGNEIADVVSAKLNELYPQDRAVGFEVGDLRGVFWVEYPLVN